MHSCVEHAEASCEFPWDEVSECTHCIFDLGFATDKNYQDLAILVTVTVNPLTLS